MGNRTMTGINSAGRRFENLPKLLAESNHASVLIKMDIEGSELDVLEELNGTDFVKILALTVEFHVFSPLTSRWVVERVARVMKRLQSHFVVVHSSMQFFGCSPFLKMMARGGGADVLHWADTIGV